MASNTVRVVPPIYFYGDDSVDNISPETFLREALNRMDADATINTDALRIKYIVGHLREQAHRWWQNITRSSKGDPLTVFDDFKQSFCRRFKIDSLRVSQVFRTKEINTQSKFEDIQSYHERVAGYFNDKMPIKRYTEDPTTAFNTALAGVEQITQVQRTAIRAAWATQSEKVAKSIFDNMIKQIWMEGLHSQFRNAATQLDAPNKEMVDLLIALDLRFPESRLQKPAKRSANHRINAIEDTNNDEDLMDDMEDDDDEVCAIGGARPKREGPKKKQQGNKVKPSQATSGNSAKTGEKCSYCKFNGHTIDVCRKKARRDAQRTKVNGVEDNSTASQLAAMADAIRQIQIKAGAANAIGHEGYQLNGQSGVSHNNPIGPKDF